MYGVKFQSIVVARAYVCARECTAHLSIEVSEGIKRWHSMVRGRCLSIPFTCRVPFTGCRVPFL